MHKLYLNNTIMVEILIWGEGFTLVECYNPNKKKIDIFIKFPPKDIFTI